MKALVLGATGFIGSHVARRLVEEGLDVRILRRSSSPTLALEGLKVETVTGDLSDLESLQRAARGCDALFHVAGYYPLYSSQARLQKPIALQQIRNVLKASEGLKKIVFTSSMSTIGKTIDGRPSNEDTPYDTKYFTGLYYQIKYEIEQEVLAAAAQGLPVVVVNPTGVFGDYDVKPTSGTLVVEIAKGRIPFIFDAPMNAIDVRDVAQGQFAALQKGVVGRRYILGAHNTRVFELAGLIARTAGVRPPLARIPLVFGEYLSTLSEYAGRLFHQEKPLMPKVGIDFLKYGMHYDTSRAQQELGLKVVPLEETFERAVAWFRQHHYF